MTTSTIPPERGFVKRIGSGLKRIGHGVKRIGYGLAWPLRFVGKVIERGRDLIKASWVGKTATTIGKTARRLFETKAWKNFSAGVSFLIKGMGYLIFGVIGLIAFSILWILIGGLFGANALSPTWLVAGACVLLAAVVLGVATYFIWRLYKAKYKKTPSSEPKTA